MLRADAGLLSHSKVSLHDPPTTERERELGALAWIRAGASVPHARHWDTSVALQALVRTASS